MLTQEDIQALKVIIKGEIEPINKRLDGIDKRLDGIDKRLDGIDERLDIIEESLEEVRAGTNEALKWLDINYHNDFDRKFPAPDPIDPTDPDDMEGKKAI